MDKVQQPIGVFDSGVGGISVLRELVALMPNENYIFFGDSRHAPYGTKEVEEVRQLTCADARHLLEQGAKALVIACNTATSAAAGILRSMYKEVPVIGIEPALKPAVLSGSNPRVLVMATPMTLREEKFYQLMLQYQKDAEIIPLPCPGLVEFVEKGILEGADLEGFLRELFWEYERNPVDCVVLGCTHYPFVKREIQKALGDGVLVFDGGAGTARETRRRLEEARLLNPSGESGNIEIQNSMDSVEILNLSRKLFCYGRNTGGI